MSYYNPWLADSGPKITELFESLETRTERREFEKFVQSRGGAHWCRWPHVMALEAVAWLHRRELRSEHWARAPFSDHVRCCSSTWGRTIFLQPYRDSVRRELGLPPDVDNQLLLERALLKSREFATAHGLSVKVYKQPGWHSKECLLIEYTKQKGERAC